MHLLKITVALSLLFSACAPWPSAPGSPAEASAAGDNAEIPLRIAVIDVGQGDSTLIETPSGDAVLIDAGPPESGYAAVLPTLRGSGLTHLSAMILSHYDADHIGGAVEVLSGEDRVPRTDDDFWPEIGLYDRGEDETPETAVYLAYRNLVQEERTVLSAGQVYAFADGLEIRCLIVNGIIREDGHETALFPEEELPENARSAGLLIRYGDFIYWTGGDLPGDPSDTQMPDFETAIAASIGPVDLLHLHHHGSGGSTSEKFLDVLSPKAAIISAGDGNRYGHPTLPVADRLIERGIAVYATHTYDDAIFNTLDAMSVTGDTIWISAKRSGEFQIEGDSYP